ncbi:MAG: hypothetical protein LUC90_01505 [Lachnospiraceae bacterium]|nr:hypothetical protein [Lachnospiraceae bacterium]
MKIIFKMFARYTSQAKGRFCLMLLFTFSLTGLETGLALLMRDIISAAEINGTLQFLLLSVLGFALLLGLDSLLSIGRYLSCDLFGESFIGALRADLLRAVESADYEAILGIGRDKLKNILYYDTLNVFRTVGFQMETIFMNAILLLAFLAVAAYVNPLLSLILLTATVVGFLISFFSRKYIVRVSSGVNAQMKADNAVLNEFSDSLELVKTHSISDYFLQKQDKSFKAFIKASLRADAPIVGISSLETNYHQLVYLGIAAYLSMVLGGDGAGDLVFFLFATEKVISLSTSLESSLYAILRMAPSFVNARMLLDMEQPDGDVSVDSIDTIGVSQ